MASSELACKNCGACCVTGKDNHDCRYLLRIGKSSMCTIYEHRIGTNIAPGYICGFRSDTKYDFEGCPMNSGKEIFKK